jgi:hypothetical protein
VTSTTPSLNQIIRDVLYAYFRPVSTADAAADDVEKAVTHHILDQPDLVEAMGRVRARERDALGTPVVPPLFHNTLDSMHPIRIVQLLPISGAVYGWYAVYARVTEGWSTERHVKEGIETSGVWAFALIEREHPQHGTEQDLVALVWDDFGQAEIANDDPSFIGLHPSNLGPPNPVEWAARWKRKTETEGVVQKTEAQPW